MKNIIKRIAKEFNNNKVVWAIGGSYLLKRYGINTKSDYLDIMVSDNSITKVLRIMDKIAIKQDVSNSDNYQTEYFVVYMMDGYTINIICNLKSNFTEEFDYGFTKDDIHVHEFQDEESVYYGYLMDWYLIYSEVNLVNELALIEEYYVNGGFFNNSRFEKKFKNQRFQIIDNQYNDLKNKLY